MNVDSSVNVQRADGHVRSCPVSSLTLWVQQPGDAQLSLRHAESLLQILLVALAIHQAHVDQAGSVDSKNRKIWIRKNMRELETSHNSKRVPLLETSATRMFKIPPIFSRKPVSALSASNATSAPLTSVHKPAWLQQPSGELRSRATDPLISKRQPYIKADIHTRSSVSLMLSLSNSSDTKT